MSSKPFRKLEEELYQKRIYFKDILPWTAFGSVGGAIATTFQLARYLRTPRMEGLVRFVSGSADSIIEGMYTLVTELPKYFKKTDNKGGPVVYYVGGKLIGAALSWLPDYILRSSGIDVHSPFPGAIVPTAYAQFDQIGAYLGMLVYHSKKHGLRKGFVESIKDPVSQTSLMVTGASVVIDGGIRTQFTPVNFWYDWMETWALSFLCQLPVWRGRIAEDRLKRK